MAKSLKRRTLKPGIRVVTVRLSESELSHLQAIQQKRAKKSRRIVHYQEIMVHSLMGIRGHQIAKSLPEARATKRTVHTLTVRLAPDEIEHLQAIRELCSLRRSVPYQEIMVRGLMEIQR